MLRHLHDLSGYSLRATDGDIGTVKDFYFDDERWTIRYLVVETGSWLSSRKVLIAPASLGVPDDDAKVLPVSITREQVRDSPDVDTDKPVSRQHEIDYLRYYGYPAYWDSPSLWGAGALPGMMMPENGLMVPTGAGVLEAEAAAADVAAQHRDDDPHLRSCRDVTGYHLKAQDGEIGHVQDWIVDQQSWAIRYLAVETGHWWSGRKVLIAPQWIGEVSWAERTVAVALTQQAVRDAPEWDSTRPPDRAHEVDIYKHYDRTGYW